MKIQENMISGQSELFNKNKKMNEKLTRIQKKFDLLACDNEKLQSTITVAEETTITLQENISFCNFRITELERSVQKV